MSSSSIAPLADHRAQLDRERFNLAGLEIQAARIAYVRFALALVVVALVLLVIVERAAALWLLVPIAGFALLGFGAELTARRQRRAEQTLRFHERIVARLEDRWAGAGVPGTEFLPPDHPCAEGLDLFGVGSLYERICQCGTRDGRETLASWLLNPAPPDEVLRRQEALRELVGRPEWRERFFVANALGGDGINTMALGKWGEIPGKSPGKLRIAALAFVALSAVSVIGWLLRWWSEIVPALLLVIQAGFAVSVAGRVARALAGLDRRSADLFRLAGLLALVEREKFTSALATAWQRELLADGLPPSESIRQLARLIEQLDKCRNFLFAIVSPFVLWTTQWALAVEAWRRRAGSALGRWGRVLGEAEAIASVAGYAAENPLDTFPDVCDGDACFEAKALGHPLLPRAKCVTNDLTLNATMRLLVVSGSNMSGKSTLLRAVGINAVLAQMGAPIRATSLRLSRLAVGSTLHIQDSLQQGKSRFFAEITRIRQIVELTKGPLPVLFLLDEILHGTNSHDRAIGAEAVVRGLLDRHAIGLVTTHDLALTKLADDLAPTAANVHFADTTEIGELVFDYRLKEGPVRHSNALALMRAVGLEVAE
jgi:hypothetical protein